MRIVVVLLLGCGLLAPLAAGEGQGTLGFLPGDPGAGVAPTGKPELFVGKGLFDYMDGGAERYLAYGFTEIAVRGYAKGAVKANVEIYSMGSPEDAFGIYAFNTKGEHPDVGTPATLSHGTLGFHKDRYFVRVVAMSDPGAAKDVLVWLGKQTASRLPGQAVTPALLSQLPPGAVEGSARFLPNAETARTVWFDGEGDVLITAGAKAVTALFAAGGAELQATRTTYPGDASARTACEALARKLSLSPAVQGEKCTAAGKLPDDTFGALRSAGSVLRWTSGAPDLATAQAWLDKIQ
jgi:hypothetical protein